MFSYFKAKPSVTYIAHDEPSEPQSSKDVTPAQIELMHRENDISKQHCPMFIYGERTLQHIARNNSTESTPLVTTHRRLFNWWAKPIWIIIKAVSLFTVVAFLYKTYVTPRAATATIFVDEYSYIASPKGMRTRVHFSKLNAENQSRLRAFAGATQGFKTLVRRILPSAELVSWNGYLSTLALDEGQWQLLLSSID